MEIGGQNSNHSVGKCFTAVVEQVLLDYEAILNVTVTFFPLKVPVHCEHDCTPISRSNLSHFYLLTNTHLKLPCCVSREQTSLIMELHNNNNNNNKKK